MTPDHTGSSVFKHWTELHFCAFSLFPSEESGSVEPWLTFPTDVHREMDWTGRNGGRKINYNPHAVQSFSVCVSLCVCASLCVCVFLVLFVSECVSHLRRCFPLLFTDCESLHTEAGFETLRARSARFVHGLWALCTDGLQKETGQTRDSVQKQLRCERLNVWKKRSTCFPTSGAWVYLPPCVLTAPQDLQWCLRLVKLKLSLQPLHVCFSLSFFLELFCRRKIKQQHRSHVKHSWTWRNVWGLVSLHPLFVWLCILSFLWRRAQAGGHPHRHTILLWKTTGAGVRWREPAARLFSEPEISSPFKQVTWEREGVRQWELNCSLDKRSRLTLLLSTQSFSLSSMDLRITREKY